MKRLGLSDSIFDVWSVKESRKKKKYDNLKNWYWSEKSQDINPLSGYI